MNRLIIIGASGHGKVVADIAVLNGYKDIVFMDDDESMKECAGYPVIGKSADAPSGDVFIAVGNAKAREQIMDRYEDRELPILVHPNSVIANEAELGKGTVVMAGAVINPGARIGKGCIVNTSSSVDHDCVIGDFVHVAVGSHLSGTATVGKGTWIGAGATISNNVSICSNCTVGAGAVVIKDIKKPGIYVGVPAVYLKAMR